MMVGIPVTSSTLWSQIVGSTLKKIKIIPAENYVTKMGCFKLPQRHCNIQTILRIHCEKPPPVRGRPNRTIRIVHRVMARCLIISVTLGYHVYEVCYGYPESKCGGMAA